MPHGIDRYRAKYGVTTEQKQLLSRMEESGTIARTQLGNNVVQTMHRLVNRGLVVHVPSITDKPTNDSWRLTETGRILLKQW